MLSATAAVALDRPERYVKQLVSHLGRKAETEQRADGVGEVVLTSGRCLLTPEPGALRMRAVAEDEESLATVQDVVARHLVRFVGEQDLTVVWAQDGAAPPTGG